MTTTVSCVCVSRIQGAASGGPPGAGARGILP
eukprot:CAMPEP_0185196096 /NCGR_PEP_ID=MMETSP1140-20130426/36596_1 /TAXON_ID=298111 /ORGANISM="Pavlova sp., Strain CCMP459" /LENGTH=31 /DNA_ID= /DNA_START= /DNA_END= /DNA_ORIENTATION=